MSELITVSVLVPSYQHEAFVADAVRSALAQDGVALEVIAIDDGSTDQSLSRLQAIDDPRLRVVHHANRGLSRTLNRGLQLARGRWAKMLPSDDLLEPDSLAGHVEALEKAGQSLGFARPTIVDEADVALHDPAPQAWFDLEADSADAIFRTLAVRNALCAPSALFDRALALRVGGFDPSLRVAQDYDLWLRLLPHTDAVVDPARRVRARWHGENQSARATEATEAERAYALVGSLVRCGLQEWGRRFGEHGYVGLAEALLASGLREVRPFARAALVAAREAGVTFTGREPLEAFLREAPELARPGPWGGVSEKAEGRT